jgi:hypothetical protein
MDMAGCGGTYFSPKQGQMTLKSFIWRSNIEGDILFTHGHVHEVGVKATSLRQVLTSMTGRRKHYSLSEREANLHQFQHLRENSTIDRPTGKEAY